MKTKNWLIVLTIIIIVGAAYFVIKNRSKVTYTSAQYGYAIDISKDLKYQEFNQADGSGVGLLITNPSLTSPGAQVSINVMARNNGGSAGVDSTLNGLPAKVWTGQGGGSQGNSTVKTYQIVHNNKVYDINIIPADDSVFQAVADTFRFIE
ncbi:MAG: hypothetical protein V4465_03205 [Patescibacteria group bacterium]